MMIVTINLGFRNGDEEEEMRVLFCFIGEMVSWMYRMRAEVSTTLPVLYMVIKCMFSIFHQLQLGFLTNIILRIIK